MTKSIAIAVVLIASAAQAQTHPSEPADTLTLKNIKIQGSLDLENNVPIRWKKPDGSGYVNIFMLDKNGTLRLCDDPYYYDATKDNRKDRVIEIRNPNSQYPDLRLPITRNRENNTTPGRETYNADSKLHLRSATFTETNDPSELNLVRTGTDDPNHPDDNGSTANGAVPGLIRWMSRKNKGIVKDAELIARSYGTSREDHYGAVIFQVEDSRPPKQEGGTMVILKSGVRVGRIQGAGGGVTGSMFEVDCPDERPMIIRRPNATTTQPVMLALASGAGGTEADESSTLARFQADTIDVNARTSRLQIQTNHGKSLKTDWTLPVPAARVSIAAGQKISTGQLVPLTIDAKLYDNDGMYDAKTKGGTRLTCRTPGRYAIAASVEFPADSHGSRQVLLRRNGEQIVATMRVPAVDGETTQITLTAPPIELQPGDYVELLVRQTSGQTLELPITGELRPTFGMTRAG